MKEKITKTKRLEALGCVFLFVMMFCIASISAAEFDNTLSYSKEDLKVTVENIFGLGHDIATAELISHKSVDEVLKVIPGKDRRVMIYDIDVFDDIYENAIGTIEIKNKRGVVENKPYHLEYAIYDYVDKPIYENYEVVSTNGSKSIEQRVKEYEKVYQIVDWKDLTSKDLVKGKITIALVTDVSPGDYYDGVFQLFGKQITKHAVWTEDLTKITRHYYAFDEGSGTQTRDEVLYNQKNITGLNNGRWAQTGKINGSYYSGGGAGIDMGFNSVEFDYNQEMTISVWINISATGGEEWVMGNTVTGNTGRFYIERQTSNRFRGGLGATTLEFYTSGITEFQNFVYVLNSSSMTWYINGTKKQTVDTPYNFTVETGNYKIFDVGGAPAQEENFDEIAFFNRSLTPTEVSDLWNNGAGIQYKSEFTIPDLAPTVELTTPANNTLTNFKYVNFNCSARDDQRIENVSVYIDGVRNYTEVNGVTNYTSLNLTRNMAEGFYTWNCLAVDNATTKQESFYNTNYTLNVSWIAPNVILRNPENFINTSTPTMLFNCTATDDIGVYNVTLFINDLVNYSVMNASSELELSINRSFADGLYNWSCNATDVYGKTNVSNEVRYFTIDTTPPGINILTPLNNSIILGEATTTEVSFNVSIVEDYGLSNCWYSNGTGNTSINCRSNATIVVEGGYNEFIYYANDSAGNIGYNITRFLYNGVQILTNSTASAIEGEEVKVYFNLSASLITQINATLNYNKTEYQMTILTSNATSYQFYYNLSAPLTNVNPGVTVNYNVTYWLNGVMYNTSLYSMTILNTPGLSVGTTCEGNVSLTFSLFDEETFERMRGTYEYNFKYGKFNSTLISGSGNITNAYNFSLCINASISPNFTLGYGEIWYRNYSGGYVDRRYYTFENIEINTTIQDIKMYDLLSAHQTSFKLEAETSSLEVYSGVLAHLIRWYPGSNEYKIVDIGKTDEKGSTVIHVETEDVDYRIGLYYVNGSLIKLANPIRMVCLVSPCTYTLKVSPGDSDYTSFLNMIYSLTYNDTTGIWRFTYSDPSLKTSTMNLTVYKLSGTSIYPICNTSVTGASGAMLCNTSLYSGTLKAEVTRSASPGVTLAQKIITRGTNAFKSPFGLVLSLLIAVPIIFVFVVISPIAAIFGGVLSLLPAFYFGSINLGIIGGIAVMGGIVAHFLKRVS